MRLVEARVVPAADLALGRLEPFDPASAAHYPVWKDPSRDFAPGGAAGEVEHQFLNAGLAVHAAVIRRFLDAEGIAYRSEG